MAGRGASQLANLHKSQQVQYCPLHIHCQHPLCRGAWEVAIEFKDGAKAKFYFFQRGILEKAVAGFLYSVVRKNFRPVNRATGF